jgi:hypothetical protein
MFRAAAELAELYKCHDFGTLPWLMPGSPTPASRCIGCSMPPSHTRPTEHSIPTSSSGVFQSGRRDLKWRRPVWDNACLPNRGSSPRREWLDREVDVDRLELSSRLKGGAARQLAERHWLSDRLTFKRSRAFKLSTGSVSVSSPAFVPTEPELWPLTCISIAQVLIVVSPVGNSRPIRDISSGQDALEYDDV